MLKQLDAVCHFYGLRCHPFAIAYFGDRRARIVGPPMRKPMGLEPCAVRALHFVDDLRTCWTGSTAFGHAGRRYPTA
jgi:hypothetical protein